MRTNLFFLLIIFSITSFAQLNPKTKWGDVSQAEIDYKEVSFEKDAGAVIVYEEGKAVISGSIQTHVYRRIKILNERGIEAANQQLIYYSHKAIEDIKNIKAQTINIENGKTITYPVDKNSIFDVTVNEYYNAKKFTFPNVKVGSIIEFEYIITDQNLYLVDAWRFQHEYPSLFSRYDINNEMRLDYTSLMIGEKIVQFSKGKKDLSNWTLINVPSYISLGFLYNPKDMSERIVFQLRGYMKSQGFDGSSSSYQDVLSNWKELNEEMSNHFNSIVSNAVGKEIASSIPSGNNERETLTNVYNHFKQNYKWNNFYSIEARQTNREVQKSRAGNSTDLNLLLNSVLKSKDFKTDLVLLSTRDHGKIVTSYPYLGQFNLVINLVTLSDGSTLLLDASDLTYEVGYPPLRNFNHYGLIVDPKNERFISLHPLLSEYHSTQNYVFRDGKYMLTRNEKRNGYFKEKSIDLPKGIEKYNPQTNALDLLTTEKKRDSKNADENNYEMERIMSETAPINNSSFMGVENPLLPILSSFQLKEPTRERALEFNFPFYFKTDVIVEIPEGYKAEIPQDFNSHNKTKANDLVYFQSAELKDGKIIMHYEFLLQKAVYDQNYPEIKSFFEKSNQDASKAVLLKKN